MTTQTELQTTPIRYKVKVVHSNGLVAYLEHRDRTSWCKQTAKKHLKEFEEKHLIHAELEII